MTRILFLSILAISLAGCDSPPDPRRTNFRIDKPGVSVQFDNKTGHLKKIEIDQNKNGRMDMWSYWDGTRLDRIEIDKDEDGKIERWEYFGPKSNTQVIKVGSSSKDDGIEDTWTYPAADDPLAVGMVETDTDRDGKIDKRETFTPAANDPKRRVLTKVEMEIDASGKAGQTIYYKSDGSFDRVERPK